MKEIIVELSHNCNLSCIMCGFGGKPISKERFMTWGTLDRILDQLPCAPERIRLNGRGESLIHPDFVQMLGHVRAKFPTSVVNLFSNLSISSLKTMQALIDYDVQLFVSIDSPDPKELEAIRKGASFSNIERNLDLLQNAKRRPYAIFTIQEDNLHRLVEMTKYCTEKEMHIIFNTVRRDEGIEPFVELVKSKRAELIENYKKIRSLCADNGLACLLPDSIHGIFVAEGTSQVFGNLESCPAFKEELCFHFDGVVTPCNMFNPYEYGNILDNDLDTILSGDRYLWFVENHKSYYYCANCACMGGTA